MGTTSARNWEKYIISSRDDSDNNLSSVSDTSSSEDEFLTPPEVIEVEDSFRMLDLNKLKTAELRPNEAYTFLTGIVRRVDDKITNLNDDSVKEYLARAIMIFQTMLLRSRILFHQNEETASTSKTSEVHNQGSFRESLSSSSGSVEFLPVLDENVTNRTFLSTLKSCDIVRSLEASKNNTLSNNTTKSTEEEECHETNVRSLRRSSRHKIYKTNVRKPLSDKGNRALPNKTKNSKAVFSTQKKLTDNMNLSDLNGDLLEYCENTATSTPNNVLKKKKVDNLVSEKRENKKSSKLKVSPRKKCPEILKSRTRLAEPEVSTSHGLKSKALPPKLKEQTPSRRSTRIENNAGKLPLHLDRSAYVTLCIQKALGKPLPDFEMVTLDDIIRKRKTNKSFCETPQKRAKMEASRINQTFAGASTDIQSGSATKKTAKKKISLRNSNRVEASSSMSQAKSSTHLNKKGDSKTKIIKRKASSLIDIKNNVSTPAVNRSWPRIGRKGEKRTLYDPDEWIRKLNLSV